MNYRLGNYSAAAVLFDKQIALYPGGKEIRQPSYWRGRFTPISEHQPAMAAAYYQTVSRVFEHHYYAQLSRDRLAELGSVTSADVATCSNIQREEIPALTDPRARRRRACDQGPSIGQRRFERNIPAEIQAADGSEQWGAFAEAEIYSSDGQTFRHRAGFRNELCPSIPRRPSTPFPWATGKFSFPSNTGAPLSSKPRRTVCGDPYMVASLIRQESEFNPAAISSSNAFGLIRFVALFGRLMAREEGISRHFNEVESLNPETNIRLGSRYLKQTFNKFDGQAPYAFPLLTMQATAG